ncbi:MAG TPA: hypothetical protein VMX79_08165 [bacterium]|nr:hypothetical protein [bacterium]
MALFADFLAVIVAVYVLFRCVDIASNWFVKIAKGTYMERSAKIVLGIINIMLAGVTFVWAAWWFYNMIKAGIEIGKSLSKF